jgi:hypothetical protein
MTRHGALIVFREGITKEEAASALAVIAPLLDLPADKSVPVYAPMQEHRLGPKKVDRFERKPFTIDDAVQTFDDDHGCWPTFYIP